MLKNFLSPDSTYHQMTSVYEKKDAFVAIGVFIFTLLLFLGAGFLHFILGVRLTIELAIVLLVFVVVAIVHLRGQKFNSVGFTLRHFKKALVFGTVLGAIISLPTVISHIMSGHQWRDFGTLIRNIFFQLVLCLQEELMFRGYIQTRLYGIIKSDVPVSIICGLMFTSIHIPFHIFHYGHALGFFLGNTTWLVQVFIMHFMFNFLYRKYNSLTAPIACHFLVNLSTFLFIAAQ